MIASMKQRYRLLRGSHGRTEESGTVVYKAGTDHDVLELTDEQAKNLGDRVVLVGPAQDQQAMSASASTGEGASDWSSLDTVRHTDAVAMMKGLENVTQLQEAMAYERAHKNRPTVVDAARNRIEELKGEE
jgi:hypothetical protein